ncbi:MAG: RDD family protein [Planctomycetota bacterium]|nr:RDD family protein [Planctomycetota bacterium]MDA1113025.1 RDD family protein [Planctomycetota bacterium]
MSAEWYFALGDEQKGPISEEELRSMLLGGNLPVDIKVWSKGMSDWASAEKVPELYRPAPPVPVLTSRVEPEANPSAASAGANPFSGAPRPTSMGVGQSSSEHSMRTRLGWNRFLARLIDYYLLMMLLSLFITVDKSAEVSMVNVFMGAILTFGILGFVESWLISKWGMTPGKWIFRIRVVHQENRLLSYSEALRRTFQVLVQGMCLGIPPMNLLFQGLAFKEYLDHGTTAWDQRNHCLVQHGTMRGIHLAAAIGVSMLIFTWISQFSQAGV